MIILKRFYYCLCFALVLSLLLTPQAHAIDFGTGIAKGVETAKGYLDQAQVLKNKIGNAAQNAAKGVKGKITAFTSKILPKKSKDRVAGSKEIKASCNIADLSDVNSVKSATYQLFLNTPDYEINNRFYQDVVIQAYTSSKLMLGYKDESTGKQVSGRLDELQSAVDSLNDQLTSGGDGAEPASDQNAAWRNALHSYELYNQILQVWEQMTAIRGEYEAARTIRTQAIRQQNTDTQQNTNPQNTGSQKNSSLLLDNGRKYASSEVLVFAQQTADPYQNNAANLVDAPAADIASPYAQSRDQIAELAKIEPLYNQAVEAMGIHNLMQSLPEYRELFINYDRALQRHQKSIEMLQLSEKCVLGHLGRYYDDPVAVWSGVNLGQYVYAHELRKGISGWAVNAFSTAKANTPNTVNVDNLPTAALNQDVDPSDLTKTPDTSTPPPTVSPDQQAELEKNDRENEMIAFNIGAEASKMLALDQHTNAYKWGKPKVKYPLWNDQKSFYDQYIDGKYDNIIDYLRFADLRMKGLNVISELVNKVIKNPATKTEYREYVKLMKNELAGQISSDDSSDNSPIEAAQKGRTSAIAAENARYNQQTASLQSRKDALNAQLKALVATADQLGTQYNQTSQDAEQAASSVKANQAEIQTIQERYGTGDDSQLTNATTDKTTTITRTQAGATTADTTQSQVTLPPIIPAYVDQPYNPTLTNTQTETTYTPGDIKQDTTTDTTSITGVQTTTETDILTNTVQQLTDEQVQEIKAQQQKSGGQFLKRPVPAPVSGNQSYYLNTSTLAFGQLMEAQPATDQDTDQPGQFVDQTTTEQEVEMGQQTATTTTTTQDQGLYTATTTTNNTNAPAPAVTQAEQEPVTATVFTTQYTTAPDTAIAATATGQVIEQKNTQTDVLQLQTADIAADTADQQQVSAQKTAAAKSLSQQVEDTKAQITKVQNSLAALDKELQQYQDEHITNINKIEAAYDTESKAALGDYVKQRAEILKNRKSLSDIYKAKIMPLVLAKAALNVVSPDMSFEDVVANSEKIMGDAEAYVEQAVNQARQDIHNMGDDLYFPETNPKVVDRHKQLMTELKSLPVANLTSFSGILSKFMPAGNIADIVTNVYSEILIQKACADDACLNPDTRYFVGYYGKTDDFKAPFAPPALYLPNVREVIHFDTADYTNLVKDKNGGTSKDAFMNIGSEIPQIWTMLLDDKIFVEKPVDLSKVLGLGGEATLFMSGGRYPCNTGTVVVNVNAIYDAFVLSPIKAEDKINPTCTDVSVQGSTITDYESGASGKPGLSSATSIAELLSIVLNARNKTLSDSTSELGIFLKTDGQGGLAINDSPHKVFERLKQLQENQSKDSFTNPTLKDVIYQKAVFAHNQIGSFLNFVETEQQYRQQSDELETSIGELRDTLNAALQEHGLEVNANLNLADGSQYDSIHRQLESIRNTNVSQGLKAISKVNVSNNDIVSERLNKVKNMYAALQKDKNALISLSEVTDPGSALDEAIKAEEANNKARTASAAEAQKQFEDSLSRFPRPFCASY